MFSCLPSSMLRLIQCALYTFHEKKKTSEMEYIRNENSYNEYEFSFRWKPTHKVIIASIIPTHTVCIAESVSAVKITYQGRHKL